MTAVTKKLKRGVFQHVEGELAAYWETVRELEELKKDFLHAQPFREHVGRGRSNLVSDPTGNTAILMVSHRRIEQMERIVRAIEQIYKELTTEKKRLVQMRYWTRPQSRTWEGIAQELYISERQARRWRDQIINGIANRIGWQ